MRIGYELLPIIIFGAIAIFAIAAAIIINIRSKESPLHTDDDDFIKKLINKKKDEIERIPGKISFRLYGIMIVAFPVIIIIMFTLVIHDIPAGVVCAIISLFIPDLLVKVSANRQKKNFEEQYGRALKTLASNLQSGMSIQQAIEDITNDSFGLSESVKKGFRQIDSDIKIGIPIPDAFEKYVVETKSTAAADVAAAIRMQSEVGGSEAQVIQSIAYNITDRMMMRKEMKALFADTSMMVNIMGVIPFVMIAFLYFFARQLVQPFFESIGMFLVMVLLLAFAGLGTIWLRNRLRKAKGGDV